MRRTRLSSRFSYRPALFFLAWSSLAAFWAVADVEPVRFGAFVLWGIASTIVWGWVLLDAYDAWKEHRDRRSKRELMRDGSLFLTAIGSTLAIVGVLFGESGTTPRALVLAIALGAFLGAGIVTLGLRQSEKRGQAP